MKENFEYGSKLCEIHVDASKKISDTSRHPIGININYLRDDNRNLPGARPIQEALKEMGVRFLRYPGGEKSDYYLWSVPPYSASNPQVFDRMGEESCAYAKFAEGHHLLGFDSFMNYCREVGATPHIVVGASPYEPEGKTKPIRDKYIEHAVSWVRYANLVKNYGVQYWEIGNENWKTFTAEENAELAIVFSKAMKAVDPSIKTGICGISKEYFKTTLEIAGDSIDFLTMSDYPCSHWGSYDYYVQNPRIDLNPEATHAIEALNEVGNGIYKDKIKIAIVEANSWDWFDGWPIDNTLGHTLVTFEILGQALSRPQLAYVLLWGTRWMDYNGTKISEALGAHNEINPSGRAVAIWGQFLLDELVEINRTDTLVTFASKERGTGKLNLFLSNKGYEGEKVSVRIHSDLSYERGEISQFKGMGPDDMKPEWVRVGGLSFAENCISEFELPAVSITVISLSIE